MARVSAARTFWASLWIAMTTLLVALSAPAVAHADKGETTRYQYKVVSFDYHATGNMSGAILPGDTCSAGVDAVFRGHVDTIPSNDLSGLRFGDGTLKVHNGRTKGTVNAEILTESTLSDTYHILDTDCVGGRTTTNCTDVLESKLTLYLTISGGAGSETVRSDWSFGVFGDFTAGLVPNSFTCVEPIVFPGFEDGTCQTFPPPDRFTAKTFKLPFNCSNFARTTTPPNGGVNWTEYAGVAGAKGALRLKRTKQS